MVRSTEVRILARELANSCGRHGTENIVVIGSRLHHDRTGPPFDLPVEAGAAPDVDPQAAVVAIACVLTAGCRLMPLERGSPELIRSGACHRQPKALGILGAGFSWMWTR